MFSLGTLVNTLCSTRCLLTDTSYIHTRLFATLFALFDYYNSLLTRFIEGTFHRTCVTLLATAAVVLVLVARVLVVLVTLSTSVAALVLVVLAVVTAVSGLSSRSRGGGLHD